MKKILYYIILFFIFIICAILLYVLPVTFIWGKTPNGVWPYLLLFNVFSVFLYIKSLIPTEIYFKKGEAERNKIQDLELRAKIEFFENLKEWDGIMKVLNSGTEKEIDTFIDHVLTMRLSDKQKEFAVEYCIYVLKYKEATRKTKDFSKRENRINEILKFIREKM